MAYKVLINIVTISYQHLSDTRSRIFMKSEKLII